MDISILIVEDEPIIAFGIKEVLENEGYLIAGICDNGAEAIKVCKEKNPDLVLMDINIKGEIDGIECAETINAETPRPIIFLTGNSDRSTFERAKQTRPYAFIPKPFDRYDLAYSIELAIERFEKLSLSAARNQQSPVKGASTTNERQPNKLPFFLLDDRMFIRVKSALKKVYLKDILWLEADGAYCKIITRERKFLASFVLKMFEGKLDERQFVRIHRSFIINLNEVEEIAEKYVIINDQQIPIGRAYKEFLYKRLNPNQD